MEQMFQPANYVVGKRQWANYELGIFCDLIIHQLQDATTYAKVTQFTKTMLYLIIKQYEKISENRINKYFKVMGFGGPYWLDQVARVMPF